MNPNSKPDDEAGEGNGSTRPEFLTLRQAAAELQVSAATLRRAYHSGELRAFLIACALRIRRTDLEAWVAGQMWTESLRDKRTARPDNGRCKPKKSAPQPVESAAAAANRTVP